MTTDEFVRAKTTLANVKLALREGHLMLEERARLEALSVELSGRMIRPWLPANRGRKILVFALIAVGLYGMMEGPHALFWALPAAFLFSPRFVGEY